MLGDLNNILTNTDVNKIINFLYVRPDELSENIISMPILKAIKQKYINSKISVVCQSELAELYFKNPFVDTIIVVQKEKFSEDEEYRKSFIKKMQNIEFDISLNPVFSRDPLTDYIALGSNAAVRIAFEGDTSNISPEAKYQNDQFYTMLINIENDHISEIERYKQFLSALNIEVAEFFPELFSEDKATLFAEKFYKENGLLKENTIVVYPFDEYGFQNITYINELAASLSNFNFIILGFEVEDSISKSLDSKIFNLIGKITILEAAAISKNASMVITAGVAGLNIACAANIKNIIISGGGEFGRFYPYSSLTSVIALPLDCYGCNWNCRFNEKFCLTKLDYNFILKSIKKAISSECGLKPRVYAKAINNSDVSLPKWKWFNSLLNIEKIELVSFEELPEILNVDALLMESENEISIGNYSKAKNILNSIITEYPEQTEALNNLSVIEILEKNFDKAIVQLTKIIKLDPDNLIANGNIKYLEIQVTLYNKLLDAEGLIKADKFEDAKIILNEILKSDDTYADALNDLAVIDILEQNYDDAYAKINKVFQLEPNNQNAADNLAFLKEMLRKQNT